MGSRNHLEVVGVVELLGNILAEGVACASRIHTPPSAIVRIRPKQVTHRSIVGHFLESLEGPNVVQGLDARRKPSVQTEELILNHSCRGKKVKELSKAFPDIRVTILPAAFIIETIDLSDLPCLVVASQDSYPVFVSHF